MAGPPDYPAEGAQSFSKAGFEPATYSFTGCRSSKLSYMEVSHPSDCRWRLTTCFRLHRNQRSAAEPRGHGCVVDLEAPARFELAPLVSIVTST